MNRLDETIIICDSPKKSARTRFMRNILKSRNGLTETIKMRNAKSPKRRRKTRPICIHQRLRNNRKEELGLACTSCRVRDPSFESTVITLSDDENLSSDKHKSGTQNNKYDSNNPQSCPVRLRSSIAKQTRKSLRLTQQAQCDSSLTNNETDQHRKRKKISVSSVSSDNETCLIISDEEDPEPSVIYVNLADENAEPLQQSVIQVNDDVTLVEPAPGTSLQNNTCQKNTSPEDKNQTCNNEASRKKTTNVAFVIDTQPDLTNLRYLKSEEEPPSKKPRIEPESKTPENNVSTDSVPQNSKKKKKKGHKKEKLSSKKKVQETASDVNSNINIYHPQANVERGKLREIIVDGCNIAMAHTNGKGFSETGLKLVVDYFRKRGHLVKVFVPQDKRSFHRPLLEKLHSEGIVVFTPSRIIGGKKITSYDDRFIIQYATICGGIVVSLDQYRDLYQEKPEWRDTIENRLLAPTFVGNCVMFPEDPLGRHGPRLDEFLRY